MLAEVATRLEADLEAFASDFVDRVLPHVQATCLVPPATMEDYLRRGVVIGARDALSRLHSEVDGPREFPQDLFRLAGLVRDQRSELAELADTWMAGQEVFWECFESMAERTLDDAVLRWEVVKAARATLSGYSLELYKLFRTAMDGASPGDVEVNGGSKLEAVSRALRGTWVDTGELGYDLDNHHVAVVADTSLPLKQLAERTGRHLLKVHAPGGGVWGWLGGQARLPDAELDGLVAWQRSGDGRVAFGEPAKGVTGFSVSHDQALEAGNIAFATNDRVVRFADVRLLIALMRDTQLAKGFVERELGELGHPGTRMTELRATLRVYLEQGQRVSTTAALRHRDRKTILRQLHSAERLIRHYVCERSDEVLIALRAAEILRRRGSI